MPYLKTGKLLYICLKAYIYASKDTYKIVHSSSIPYGQELGEKNNNREWIFNRQHTYTLECYLVMKTYI